jgi:signal transduction histidine kinase
MDPRPHRRFRLLTGLSGRLLALTAAFVMLAEVLVFVPSISRFRLAYLEERIEKAHLAVLALEATPNNMLGAPLEQELLFHAGAYSVALKAPDRRMLMLSGTTQPAVDVTFDLREETVVDWIGDALRALIEDGNRVMRVIAQSPRAPEATIEVLLDEAPMRRAMLHYARRILVLSLIISFITACLVYISLQWLLVRPMRQLIDSIIRFRGSPEDPATAIRPGRRRDEIGLAQRELAAMQHELRQALLQKTRLAAIGSAVAKINHDLKNTLATAVLASDRLAEIDDAQVQRLAPRLIGALDRAVALCGRTLEFVRSEQPPLRESRFLLSRMLAEVGHSLNPGRDGAGGLRAFEVSDSNVVIEADYDQLFRAFANLCLNAVQAGATTLRITARREDGMLAIDVTDNGPGIPATVQQHLFQPFATASRNGGSGLGLVIAREIAQLHGGNLSLDETGASGTTFRLELPARRVRAQAA